MCGTRLAENVGPKKVAKNRHLGTIAQLCQAISSQPRHVSTIRKKRVKQQYVLKMFPQYGEYRPTNGWDRFGSLGHPIKFQRLSRFALVTAATSLTGGQPNFAGCLAVSWAATLYIHFRGLLPLTEFCPVQNSLYVQILRSHILRVLLHGTPAASVNQTLQCRTTNGITESFAEGATYIWRGGHHFGHRSTFWDFHALWRPELCGSSLVANLVF